LESEKKLEAREKPKKVVTRVVRLDEEIDKSLEDISRKEHASVNFLLNRLAYKYVELDYRASKFGFIMVSSSFQKKLLEYLSDEKVRELAIWDAENLAEEFFRFFFQTIESKDVIKTIQLHSLAGHYPYEEQIVDGTRSFVLKHNRGRKQSIFYQEYFGCLFRKISKVQAIIESTEDQVLIQIPQSIE